ncbi:MAG TPA: hypothetical protein VGL55_00160 [Steroidobacteraceae bacterium]
MKYHRTIVTTLDLLVSAGFSIERVEEFCPAAERVAARPALAEELERPMLLWCPRAADRALPEPVDPSAAEPTDR